MAGITVLGGRRERCLEAFELVAEDLHLPIVHPRERVTVGDNGQLRDQTRVGMCAHLLDQGEEPRLIVVARLAIDRIDSTTDFKPLKGGRRQPDTLGRRVAVDREADVFPALQAPEHATQLGPVLARVPRVDVLAEGLWIGQDPALEVGAATDLTNREAQAIVLVAGLDVSVRGNTITGPDPAAKVAPPRAEEPGASRLSELTPNELRNRLLKAGAEAVETSDDGRFSLRYGPPGQTPKAAQVKLFVVAPTAPVGALARHLAALASAKKPHTFAKDGEAAVVCEGSAGFDCMAFMKLVLEKLPVELKSLP